MDELTALNCRFGIPDQLHFEQGAGGLTLARISNPEAQAIIALQGAQIIDWRPNGQSPVIWLSADAVYKPGKSIRGGVPICWPWFGPHALDNAKPAHGFARNQPWEVINTTIGPKNGETQILLQLCHDELTHTIWPYEAELVLNISVGSSLHVELITLNKGSTDIVISEALHTYFAVSDIEKVTIHGLDECIYIDKVDHGQEKRQIGPISIHSEVDRIYQHGIETKFDCHIDDKELRRRILIQSGGSASTVVWNPWQEKSTAMGDLGEKGFRSMVCVETANAATRTVTIKPGHKHHMWAQYDVVPL